MIAFSHPRRTLTLVALVAIGFSVSTALAEGKGGGEDIVVPKADESAPIPDLSVYDRDTLISLCKNLYQRVAELEKKLRQISADEVLNLREQSQGQQIVVTRLRNANQELQHRLEQAEREAMSLRFALRETLDQSGESQPAAGGPAEIGVDLNWSYYSADGTSVYRVDGERIRESWSSIETTRMTVTATVSNYSESPYRCTFVVVAVGNKRLPAVYGRKTIQTPLLGPGEVHEVQFELVVDDARMVSRCVAMDLMVDSGDLATRRPVGR